MDRIFFHDHPLITYSCQLPYYVYLRYISAVEESNKIKKLSIIFSNSFTYALSIRGRAILLPKPVRKYKEQKICQTIYCGHNPIISDTYNKILYAEFR